MKSIVQLFIIVIGVAWLWNTFNIPAKPSAPAAQDLVPHVDAKSDTEKRDAVPKPMPEIVAASDQKDIADPFPSEQQQKCNLLIGIVAAATMWRDNQVPIDVAFGNLRSALLETHAANNDYPPWFGQIERVYSSRITGEEIERDLRPRCH
ncbi:hypothetical protein [Burkholderia gladioli]|uniref:hypothetical protein n=1 Tax=Burkholderia gladioli TaxID=28095 RepID=UPI0010575539|nr:hypothetical protein [Burkholderia gladioli]